MLNVGCRVAPKYLISIRCCLSDGWSCRHHMWTCAVISQCDCRVWRGRFLSDVSAHMRYLTAWLSSTAPSTYQWQTWSQNLRLVTSIKDVIVLWQDPVLWDPAYHWLLPELLCKSSHLAITAKSASYIHSFGLDVYVSFWRRTWETFF